MHRRGENLLRRWPTAGPSSGGPPSPSPGRRWSIRVPAQSNVRRCASRSRTNDDLAAPLDARRRVCLDAQPLYAPRVLDRTNAMFCAAWVEPTARRVAPRSCARLLGRLSCQRYCLAALEHTHVTRKKPAGSTWGTREGKRGTFDLPQRCAPCWRLSSVWAARHRQPLCLHSQRAER